MPAPCKLNYKGASGDGCYECALSQSEDILSSQNQAVIKVPTQRRVDYRAPELKILRL